MIVEVESSYLLCFVSDLAASGALDGDLEQLHLKLLSLLDNPAVVVAAAAHGDASTIKDYLSKHPQHVCWFSDVEPSDCECYLDFCGF